MARFFRWLVDFKRNRNSSPNSRLNPCSSPQTSDRTKSPCGDLRSCSTSLSTTTLSSWKLDSSARWSKEYDVCVCHTEDDIMYVQDLVSFFELHPHSLRCFLQFRDATPGGAVCTELCQAVRESHCWVLVITPSFLKDPWCRYQMQQALSESPMANGRIIPVRKQLERKDYPQELRFMFGIDVRQDKENGFQKIKCAIMHYLEELSRKESEYIPSSQDDPEFNMDTASETLDSSGNC
ncbi:toll/interleukin-1 receptor domain-containing adapter protein [Chiloscyllium plagiosum]|uniref:toll/interleukin-1 receptor domain-containing adapter protein n=1 Tax=Chiloscyllium plagiosum TaxID=36176 RepID=UPI001CB86C89|nr:toll/interleukin-1 receptor domain-containing adapter protein [Chiloscyllium plagiosum]XP_043532836.1 toll/interleukin-1 receptor domain-containing adapter protein [Chiloscyllium plagiosum]XP_043532837.1 toll/interleukin-1 receptor domain-containing adapter protein [Chiloscyllium plagiosum]